MGRSTYIAAFESLPSIRCKHAGRYYGGAERETQWISYPDSLRTYLDDLNSLPSKSIKDKPDRPKKLLKPLFLFLATKNVATFPTEWLSAGLILVQTEELCSKFRRVGVFEGFREDEHSIKDDIRRWVKII